MQLVADLLIAQTKDLILHESRAHDVGSLLSDVEREQPNVVVLESPSPFTDETLLVQLLVRKPEVPLILISENSNTVHVIRCETSLLNTSKDLINTIQSF
jgi:AmiR/NasT family two-component response regulator